MTRGGRRRRTLGFALALVVVGSGLMAGAAVAAEYEFERTWDVGSPTGLAVAPGGDVYVVDGDSVKRFTPQGVQVDVFGGSGSADGALDTPQGVTVGPQGQVYVADFLNYRVQEFTAEGDFVRAWPTDGPGGNDVAPFDVDTDSLGNVYVVQAGSAIYGEPPGLLKYSSTGTFLGGFGSEGVGDGQFDTPRALAVDGPGDLFVADSDNDRIQRFSPSGAFVTKWGQSGSGDGQFQTPFGVDTGPDGSVFVAAGNYKVQIFTREGAFTGSFGSLGSGVGEFDCGPRNVAVGPDGAAYTVERCFGTSRIQKFTPGGGGPGGGEATAPRIKSKSLRYRRGKIAVKLSCPAGSDCDGKLVIRKGKTKLARGGYSISAGASGTAIAKPTGRGRRILARSKSLKVAVELKPEGGEATMKKLKLRT